MKTLVSQQGRGERLERGFMINTGGLTYRHLAGEHRAYNEASTQFRECRVHRRETIEDR